MKVFLRILSVLLFNFTLNSLSPIYGQNTTALAADCCGTNVVSAEAMCGADSNFETYNFSEDFDSGGEAGGTGEAINMTNILGLTWEYSGTDPGVAGGGTSHAFNAQTAGTEELTIIFDVDHDNPIFEFGGFESATSLTITDCEGMPVTITKLGGNMDLMAGAYTDGVTLAIQVSGTHSCLKFTTDMSGNFPDAWNIQAKTCVPDVAPPVLPECVTCPTGTSYKLISLQNYDGTSHMGDIELNGVIYGSFEVLDGDTGQPGELDRNVDTKGTQFGGWDTDGGTLLMRLDFCDDLAVEQLDIRNLEVESQVTIGTSLSGSDPIGLTLTTCSDPSGRMTAVGNMVTTGGAGCGANPNGSYTIGSAVSTLYFKYHNPPGGCTGDYVGFRVGTCAPDLANAIPTCPLTLVTVTNDMADVIANGVTAALL